MIRAALLGAIAALLGVVLFSFLHGALFGMAAPFDERRAYGIEGGTNAVTALLFLVLAVWPVVVVAAAGALAGVAGRLLSRDWSSHRRGA